MSVKMKVPPSAIELVEGKTPAIRYGQVCYHLEPDLTVLAPRWLVHEFEGRGCTCLDPDMRPEHGDIRRHIEETPEHLGHEISQFLNAHGKPDHFFDVYTHALSEHHRDLAKTAPVMIPNPGAPDGCAQEYELHAATADELDKLHQMHVKKAGRGRPVVYPHADKKAKALELHDQMQALRRLIDAGATIAPGHSGGK